MASLLNQIPRESLQNLLSSLRVCALPSGNHISTESCALEPLLSSLSRGDVIEVQGPASSGKTHLLYHFVLLCIAPSKQVSMNFGGNGMVAVVYDTDATFDVARLHQLLLNRLSLTLHHNMEIARRLAEESLQRLHVFRPTSLLQLATSLLYLPFYHRACIPEHEIGLLAVDSVSAFYWADRFIAEQMRNMPQIAQEEPDPALLNPLQLVLTALGRLRLSHAPFIVLTNWGLNLASQSSGPVTFYKQHLHSFPVYSENYDPSAPPTSMTGDLPPTPMPLSLTHHITLSPVSIPPFAPEISLRDAVQQEVQYRGSTVQKGEITGLVRTAGSREIRRLTLCITLENVHIRYL
ncbi:uncharacterized protein EDB91DRAFT_277533 [Suillus paluster]|uniref:uncharacterized protein n=1 Tax=Suillus paluster TaxID=48578 RepID=UPI001B87C698|nr:uncharacterized protein EDB91DRAFT_277533 [Suillus paluster]KAG1755170.1 hypothetical protein EDB91DRAFT_277533 [Suillus paluster]